MRWRVQIEDGPATWVDAVSLVDAAAGQPAPPSPAEQQDSGDAEASFLKAARGYGAVAHAEPVRAPQCEVELEEASQEAVAARLEAAELERTARGEAEAAEAGGALPPLPEGWAEMKEVRLPTGRVPPGTSGAEPMEVICMEEMITAEPATEDIDVQREGCATDHQYREPGLRRQRDLLTGPADIEHENPDGQLDQQRGSALAAPAEAEAEGGKPWDCTGCGLRNEGCADHCALCSAEREAPSAADADEGDGHGVGVLYDDEETAGDDELQGWDEDAEAGEPLNQPRFSVINEDEVKYFQDGAKEAFAVPLPALVVDEDCLDSSNEDPQEEGNAQALADEFDDGECF